MELWYLISAHHLDDVLFSHHVSRKYLKGFQSYQVDAVCILKFSKGHNSVNSVGRVMALVLSTLSDGVLLVLSFVEVVHRISELLT